MQKILNQKFGFYLAIAVPTLTIVTFTIAYLTPPLSGPPCEANCYAYPYHDISSRFPRDYFWLYSALILLVNYLTLIVFIHRNADEEKKVYSQVGAIFAGLSSLLLILDYYLQLNVIQPSLLNKEYDGIALLTQYNPHGMFIALEELGYILMSFSFAFIAPVFYGSKLQNSIRWVLISSFTLTFLSYGGYSFFYGFSREYRFEIASISINWITLIILGILFGIHLKKTTKLEFQW